MSAYWPGSIRIDLPPKDVSRRATRLAEPLAPCFQIGSDKAGESPFLPRRPPLAARLSPPALGWIQANIERAVNPPMPRFVRRQLS